MIIFYSWQSWVKPNRNTIEDAINKAIENIKSDPEIEVVPVLDRDTFGMAGTVEIAQTIFQKIDECSIFICDITPVATHGEENEKRAIPNPNVLIELGYASSQLGWERIICVVNLDHVRNQKIEAMPFDIRGRRLLTYNSDNKKKLSEYMEDAIRVIIEKAPASSKERENLEQMILNPDKKIALKQHLKKLVDDTFANCRSSEFIEKRRAFINVDNFEEKLNGVIEFYLGYCRNMIDDFLYVLEHGADDYSEYIEFAIKKLLTLTDEDIKAERMYEIWRYIPAILFIYACGTLIISRKKYQYISPLLLKVYTKNPNEESLHNIRQSPILIVLGHSNGIYLHVPRLQPQQHNIKRLGDFIRSFIFKLLAEHVDESEFNEAFNLFEMLVAFCHTSIKQVYYENKPIRQEPDLWMFAKTRDSNDSDYIADFWYTMGKKGQKAEIIDTTFIRRPEDVTKNLLLCLKGIQDSYSSFNFPPDVRNYKDDYQRGLNMA